MTSNKIKLCPECSHNINYHYNDDPREGKGQDECAIEGCECHRSPLPEEVLF